MMHGPAWDLAYCMPYLPNPVTELAPCEQACPPACRRLYTPVDSDTQITRRTSLSPPFPTFTALSLTSYPLS